LEPPARLVAVVAVVADVAVPTVIPLKLVAPVPPEPTGNGFANVVFWLASTVKPVVEPAPVLTTNEPVVSAVCISAVPADVPAVIELIFFPYKTTQR
jgi:hypothetical protein